MEQKTLTRRNVTKLSPWTATGHLDGSSFKEMKEGPQNKTVEQNGAGFKEMKEGTKHKTALEQTLPNAHKIYQTEICNFDGSGFKEIK